MEPVYFLPAATRILNENPALVGREMNSTEFLVLYYLNAEDIELFSDDL